MKTKSIKGTSREEIIEDLKTVGFDWVEYEDLEDDVTFIVIKVK